MPAGLSTDKVCFIVVKARELNVKVPVVEPDPGSNPSEKGFREVIEDYPDDPTAAELRAFISDLNTDEAKRLVALMWVGRGDFETTDWNEALAAAETGQSQPTADYLLETPLLADYLEEGLAAFGESCLEFERDRL